MTVSTRINILLNILRTRSRAYGLLARLFGRGLRTGDLKIVRSVPDLARHVTEPFDQDEAAADHYDVFGLDIHPYAGAFLEEDGRVGGASADIARRAFEESDFRPDSSESPDHIERELRFLAHLTQTEADAVSTGRTEEAARACRMQREFLDGHMLTWLPPFLEALTKQDRPFFGALATTTLDVVTDHCASLSETRLNGTDSPPHPRSNPRPRPSLLENADSSLKDVAVYLATPARSGICLTLGDLTAISRSQRLPRGFGSKVQTLTNLLRSAAEFDRIEELTAALLQRIGSCRTYYQDVAAEPIPQIAASVEPWLDRLAETERVVRHMREAVRDISAAGDPD